MKYFPLIWSNLFRKKARTLLTLASIIVAFLLFGLLQAVNHAFQAGAENAQADRLVTNSRYSIIDLLPVSYTDRIRAVPGVVGVAHATWFGGSYRDQQAQFAVFPVVPEDYLPIATEVQLPPDQAEAWKRTRTGAIVGRSLAERMGWKIGDRIPLQADIWPMADGSLTWTFDLVGIFTDANGTANNEGALLFRHDYFDEARQFAKGRVGWFFLKIEDPSRSDEVAQAIDAMFANSEGETKTQTEKAFAQGFIKQFGDIGFIVSSILGAVFFTILVLTGNTMSQAMRERIPELGILKTLGFGDGTVLALVLAESLLLAVVGGVLGIGLAALVTHGASAALSTVGVSGLAPQVLVLAAAAMLLLGVAVGLFPALRARRLRIVDALKA